MTTPSPLPESLRALRDHVEQMEGLLDSIALPGEDWSTIDLAAELGVPGVSNATLIEVARRLRPVRDQLAFIRDAIETAIGEVGERPS
jgi:hypothetical protein